MQFVKESLPVTLEHISTLLALEGVFITCSCVNYGLDILKQCRCVVTCDTVEKFALRFVPLMPWNFKQYIVPGICCLQFIN